MSASTSTSTSALPTLGQALCQLLAKLFANFPAQCAPLDLNLGPSELSVHCWTSTWDLPSSVCTTGPQPGTFPAQCALLDLKGQIECQKICQIECQKICQIECQIECQKIGQIECQKVCQIECQIKCQICQKICQIKCQNVCQIECGKICQMICQKICQIECEMECQKICQIERQIECQKECQKIYQIKCQKICQIECQKICQIECQEGMPDRITDRMPEGMPDRMPDRMPEDMPEHMPEGMPDRMPENMADKMPEGMPENMPDRMPEGMPDRMSDRTKRINVMVGITRSKVIYFIFWDVYGIHIIVNIYLCMLCILYILIFMYVYRHENLVPNMFPKCSPPRTLGGHRHHVEPVRPRNVDLGSGAQGGSVPGFQGFLPSGKHTKNYWKLQFIVDFPIKNCDFP